VEAIVMAAGLGSRLRPLTDHVAKPVLPVDGRPVLATLLHELAAAGLPRVHLVTGHLASQVEELAGDGSAFGLEVRAVRQPEALGSADAVQKALDAGAALPALVTAADTVYTPRDVGRFLAAWAAAGVEGAVAYRVDPPGDAPQRSPIRVEDGLVLRVSDDDARNPLSAAPLWGLGPAAAARLCEDNPPWELGNAYQAVIDEGVAIGGIQIGKTRDLTYPVDLLEENFPYLSHSLQDEHGLPERPGRHEAASSVAPISSGYERALRPLPRTRPARPDSA
jgi:CTP:molybdopterin cytidylyltransferase MocA